MMKPIDTSEIIEAFDRPGFFFAYQPVFDLRSEAVTSVEALLRWDNPTLGLTAPDVFLPLIHGAGLSHELTKFTVRQTLGDLEALRRIYGNEISVAINLSREQFDEPERLTAMILAELADANEAPSALVIEVVEDVTASDMRRASTALADLRERGVRVLLDDFGTGASSLTSLIEIGYDGLKIDRSFVTGVLTSKTARSVVEAVTSFGRNTGISVVAEGVESELMLGALQDIGCTFAQGYHLGSPQPLDELAEAAGSRVGDQPRWRIGPDDFSLTPAAVEAAVRSLAAEVDGEDLAYFVTPDEVASKREKLEEFHERAKSLGRPADHLRCTIGRELAMIESQEQRHERVTELAMDTYRIAMGAKRWPLAAEMLLFVALCPWADVDEAGLRLDALTEALQIRSTKSMPDENLAGVDYLIGLTFRVLGLHEQAEQWLRHSAQRDVAEPSLYGGFACLNLIAMQLDLFEEGHQFDTDTPIEIRFARLEQVLRQIEANPFVPEQTILPFRARAALESGDLQAAADWFAKTDLHDANGVTLINAYRAGGRLAQARGDDQDHLFYSAACVDLLDQVAWYYRLPCLRLHSDALIANGRLDEGAALAAESRLDEVATYRRNIAVLFEWIRRKVDLTIRFDELFSATDKDFAKLGDASDLEATC